MIYDFIVVPVFINMNTYQEYFLYVLKKVSVYKNNDIYV